jgi:hypothetical protein
LLWKILSRIGRWIYKRGRFRGRFGAEGPSSPAVPGVFMRHGRVAMGLGALPLAAGRCGRSVRAVRPGRGRAVGRGGSGGLPGGLVGDGGLSGPVLEGTAGPGIPLGA